MAAAAAAVVAFLILFFTSSNGYQAAESSSTALPVHSDPILYISKRLGLVSGGSPKMKIYESNKLVAPFEILDAVSKGKTNSGYSIAVYW